MTLLQATLQTIGIISVQVVAGIAHTTYCEHFGIRSLRRFVITGVMCTVGAGLIALRLL